MAATAINFYAGLNLNRSSLLNARIQNLTSDAIQTPKLDGMIWYDDNAGNKHFYGYDATSAVDFKVPRLDVAETVSGLYTFNRIGAPLAVGASSFDQLVSRFNADLLDGYHADLVNNPSTIAARDGGGRMQASDPVALLDVVNLGYMTGFVAGIRDPKDAARVATTTTLPANTRTGNTLTADANGSINSPGLDGVTTLAVGDRILVHNEVLGANNGIYALTVVGTAGTPWSMVRSTDADTSAEVTNGMQLWVTEGTLYGSTGWLLTTPDIITLNATALTFIQINGTTVIAAGNGIVKVGNTIHAVTSSAYTTGAIIYATGASTLGQSAALTGVIYGNGTSAPTASAGTANYVPRWSATAPYLTSTGSIYDTGSAVGIGNVTPQAALDMGNGVAGRSIIWAGSSSLWFTTIGSAHTSAALGLLSFLKHSTSADQYQFSYTGTVPVAGIRVAGATLGDILFFNSAAAARTAGVVYDHITNTKFTIKEDGNVKVHNLTASRFVQTDASTHLASIDLFGGTNTWTGANTFSGAISVPTPTTGLHATTKDYVDGIGAIAGNGLVRVGGTLHVATSSAYTTGRPIYATGAATLGLSSVIFDSGTAIGIGTTAPGELLDIQKSTAGTGSIVGAVLVATVSTGDITDGFGSALYLGIKDAAGAMTYGVQIASIRDGADNSQALDMSGMNAGVRNTGQLWLDSSGNVGIGTVTPADQLDLESGNTTARGISIGNYAAGGNAKAKLQYSGTTASVYLDALPDPGGVAQVFGLRTIVAAVTAERFSVNAAGKIKVHNLTASRFVVTDSSNYLASIDLYGGTNTWTGANTFSGAVIVPTPTVGTHATTKDYVDALASGLRVKEPVRVATAAALPANTRTGDILTATANGSINGTGIDGVTTLAVNDRVLVKNEATQANNGIFYVSQVGDASNPWKLTRTTDADTAAEVTKGMYTYVSAGSTNISTSWVEELTVTTINTDAIAFQKFFQAAAYIAGVGLTLTGQTFAVDQAFSPTWTGAHIFKNSGGVVLDPHGTSAGNTTELRFKELAANGSSYVGIKAPDSIAGSLMWTLPGADGAAGDFLTTSGAGVLSFTATLAANHGGTGLASYAVGDILYATASTTLARRAIGTSGQILSVGAGSLPVWEDAYGLLLTTGTGTINYIAKWDSTNSLNNSLLFDNGTNLGYNTATPADKFNVVVPLATTGGITVESLDRSIISLGLYQKSSVARDYGFAQRITATVTDLVYSRRVANVDSDWMTVYNASGLVKIHSLTASMLVQTDSSTRLVSSNTLPAGSLIGGVGIARITAFTLTGAASSYTLTHSYGTLDVQIWLRNVSTGELSLANFVAISTSQVRIDFTFTRSSGEFVATVVG